MYNIVDDDPAPAAEWLPALAQTLGAKETDARASFRRAAIRGGGRRGVHDELRRASNTKAKRQLGWRPAHPSWRQGFAAL